MVVGGGAPSLVALYTWDLALQRATAGTGLIGTTATTTAIQIGRAGILATFPGDVRVEGMTTLVGGETFEGLLTVTSSSGAGAAGALGPEEQLIQNTQAATAGATIRNPGYLDWEGRFWDGAASVAAKLGRFGAVVDVQAAGVPTIYRMVWANAAGAIQWGVNQVGLTSGLGAFEVRTAIGDVQPLASYGGSGVSLGPGGAGAADWTLLRQAAGVVELGSGHSMYSAGAGRIGARAASADAQPTADIGGSALRLGPGGAGAPDARISRAAAGVLQFDNGGAGAATVLGPSDGLNVLGTAASRWARAVVNQYDVYAAASDANPTVRVITNSLAMGAGGGTALDVVLSRGAADRWEGGSGDSIATTGAGLFSNRALSGDANARMSVGSGSIAFGAGGASALDWTLSRQAAGVAELVGNSLYVTGTGVLGVRSASADANALYDLTSAGLRAGAGGGSAVDVALSRGAADRWDIGAGDSLLIPSGSLTVGGRVTGTSAAVTAANDLTLAAANQNIVSGATQINRIAVANWQAGSVVTLIFSGAPLVKHGQATGGGFNILLLAGSVDFQAAANSVLALEFDGTSWHERGRKVA